MVDDARMRTKLRQRPEDQNSKTAQLAKVILEIGPDINEASRRLGQFKESVRYRYKKLLSNGFVVQASVDYEKLGMRRVILLADFAPEYKEYGQAIMSAMSELCYLIYFERRMLTDDYLIMASVPAEFVQPFIGFMFKLKDKGIFAQMEAVPLDWFGMIPMHTELYDFDTGMWNFDWSSPLQVSKEAAYGPSEKIKFDRLDLLILKEFQVNATKPLAEIADKLKVNYKTLTWHYRKHILARKMVKGYYLRWMGTTYNSTLERALHRRHRYQHISFLARGLSQVERMDLMAKLHGVPFIWSEAVGKEDYSAELYFPTEQLTDAFEFLGRASSRIKDKANVMIMDQAEALAFTLSYQLYDEEKGAWTFNEPELLARFEALVAEIRK